MGTGSGRGKKDTYFVRDGERRTMTTTTTTTKTTGIIIIIKRKIYFIFFFHFHPHVSKIRIHAHAHEHILLLLVFTGRRTQSPNTMYTIYYIVCVRVCVYIIGLVYSKRWLAEQILLRNYFLIRKKKNPKQTEKENLFRSLVYTGGGLCGS